VKKSMKIERKIYAVIIALMLTGIFSSVATSSWLNYTGPNGSYAWTSTDQSYIVCSNGNRYNATASDAQKAVNSLSNVSGKVNFNNLFINLTTTLKLGTGCEICNFNFSIANSANKTLIMNYNLASGNKGIYIHDGYINGNGLNQPHGSSTYLMYDQSCGIWLVKCSNSTIRDVTIRNTAYEGCAVQQGKNYILGNIRVFYAGYVCYVSGTPGKDYYSAGGIFVYNCSDCTVSNCIVNNTYATGFVIESTLPSLAKWKAHDIQLTNCFVCNTTIGYYFEDAFNDTLTNCIASGCSIIKEVPYSAAIGFFGSARGDVCNYLKFYSCYATHCGQGFSIGSENATFSGCNVEYCTKGIYMTTNGTTVTGCHVFHSAQHDFYVNGKNNVFSGDTTYGGGSGYASIALGPLCRNNSFSACNLRQSGAYAPEFSLYEFSGADYTHADASNNFYATDYGVYARLRGSHSYYLLVNASTAKIGVNTSAGVTWK